MMIHRPRSAYLAFTLIEMMIVIGIIALLAALTLGISNSVIKNSEIRQTKDALKLIEMALQEWELEKGRAITFEGYVPVAGGFYDAYSIGNLIGAPIFSPNGVNNEDMLEAMSERLNDLIVLLMRSERANAILSKISPDMFIEDSGEYVLVDAWKTPIGIVYPGRNYADAYPQGSSVLAFDESGDLSLRDQAEDGLGSCKNLKPYFVSAGPDLEWGYRFQAMDGTGDEQLFEACLDNIYSYEPFIVEEAR